MLCLGHFLTVKTITPEKRSFNIKKTKNTLVKYTSGLFVLQKTEIKNGRICTLPEEMTSVMMKKILLI